MEEKLKYATIPDFHPSQTIKDIYAPNLEKQTYGLYSLTYYSGDYNLILTTLEKFIRNKSWETRYTVFQCLSRFLELYREIPVDNFLPYIIEGFDDENEKVQANVRACLENFFYCIRPAWDYKKSYINKILKSGKTIDVVKVLLFIHHQSWRGEKLSSVIKKCLKHKKAIVQCCGGVLLRLAYNNLHSQLSDFETATKLAHKLDTRDLKYFNSEVYVMVEWIEEDMSKLKNKLKPHGNEKDSSRLS
jgi:hypothetical protein